VGLGGRGLAREHDKGALTGAWPGRRLLAHRW
jgi:hypothetical protein